MSVTVIGTTFEHHHYDPGGDVLYLTTANREASPHRALATPEGHNIEYDATGRVIGMTLTNVQWLLDRDGQLTITLPADHVSRDDLSQALKEAA